MQVYPVFAKFMDVTVISSYCLYCYIEIMLIITSILDHLTHPGSNYLKQLVNSYELNEDMLLKYYDTFKYGFLPI